MLKLPKHIITGFNSKDDIEWVKNNVETAHVFNKENCEALLLSKGSSIFTTKTLDGCTWTRTEPAMTAINEDFTVITVAELRALNAPQFGDKVHCWDLDSSSPHEARYFGCINGIHFAGKDEASINAKEPEVHSYIKVAKISSVPKFIPFTVDGKELTVVDGVIGYYT